MSEHWNLVWINPKMLISFACPSKEHALSAAVDLHRSDNDDITLYVEGPRGQRIEQHEIKRCTSRHGGEVSSGWFEACLGRSASCRASSRH
jgi:hypothetical protein